MALEVKKGFFSLEMLAKFLFEIEGEFIRPLSARVGDLEKYAKKLHDHAVILTAHEDEVLVGMAAVYMNDAESHCAFLAQMVVRKAFRRRNIAQHLLKEAFSLANEKGMTAMRLEVDLSAVGAIKLYEKCGFRKEKTLSEDAVQMIRSLL